MASIDELRDIAFYVIRKLNDLIISVTTQPQQPQPQRPYRQMTEEERRRDEEGENISRRIQEIRRSLNTPLPPPSPTIREEIVDEEGENISRRIQEIRTSLDTPLPPPSPIEEERDEEWERIDKKNEEFIEDLQKQKNMKETILDYLLKRIVKLTEVKADDKLIKELKPNDIIITELQNEFDRLRLETERIDERLVNMYEVKRIHNQN